MAMATLQALVTRWLRHHRISRSRQECKRSTKCLEEKGGKEAVLGGRERGNITPRRIEGIEKGNQFA